MQLVSRAKRKRIIQERQLNARRVKNDIIKVKKCAAAKEAQDIIDKEVDGLAVANESDVSLPFSVHPTHRAVVCGGYAGCVKCGATASCEFKGNRLPAECKGPQTKSCGGAKDRIMRLLKGQHPRRGFVWPDNTRDPRPQKLRLGQQST